MLLERDVFLVNFIRLDTTCAVTVAQNFQKSPTKVTRVVVDDSFGILCEELHLLEVTLALCVTLEAILVTALLLAELTPKLELL